jgi:hypothetical protein
MCPKRPVHVRSWTTAIQRELPVPSTRFLAASFMNSGVGLPLLMEAGDGPGPDVRMFGSLERTPQSRHLALKDWLFIHRYRYRRQLGPFRNAEVREPDSRNETFYILQRFVGANLFVSLTPRTDCISLCICRRCRRALRLPSCNGSLRFCGVITRW